MAQFDNTTDPQPQLPRVNKPSRNAGRPTVTALNTALAAVNGGASYTPARLASMTFNDLVSAARTEGLTFSTTVS